MLVVNTITHCDDVQGELQAAVAMGAVERGLLSDRLSKLGAELAAINDELHAERVSYTPPWIGQRSS